jgi:15-cis-phytoene synthase
VSDAAQIDGAYAACAAITRAQAANFYYGIRLLSRPRRRAMCAAYAFARRIDDIGDGDLPDAEKLALLAREQNALALLSRPGEVTALRARAGEEGPTWDPVMAALGDAATRFPLPQEALSELIEGVRMDVEGVRYATFEELVLYCRRVAGTIGRLCLAIFGLRERSPAALAAASSLADDLGVALQLTNILRDVREDAAGGRVYLPAEDLRRFDLPDGNGRPDAAALLVALNDTAAGESQQLAELVHFEAGRAREWFARGLTLAPLLDRRSAACLLAMSGIYRRLLERIDAEPQAALRGRVSLPGREKAWVAARGLLGVGA